MEDDGRRPGPLSEIRVVEFAGLGPGPFATMMLADAGAEVIRLARPGSGSAGAVTGRGRPTLELDLKSPAGLGRAKEIVALADVLIEGFRPGVMERLGLGPGECCGADPSLIYARVSGWGPDGPRSRSAAHDINFVAAAGVLHHLARPGHPPMPPLNLVGDYGGGGMLLTVGVLAALVERSTSGRGQVVEAAMLDGINLLMSGVWNRVAAGTWQGAPGADELDAAAPYNNVYATRDGRYMAVGAFEPVFWERLLGALGLVGADLADRADRTAWPALCSALAGAFAKRSQREWIHVFAEVDACVTPVQTLDEARRDPQIEARGLLPEVDGVVQPAPAPTYRRSGAVAPGAAVPGAEQLLAGWQARGRDSVPA